MNCLRVLRLSTLVLACLSLSGAIAQGADGLPIKAVIDAQQAGENLLKPDAWFRYEAGFQREGSVWVCDNGTDLKAQRGAGQGVELNQTKPEPMVASAWSKAENVSGSADNNYSLYLDLVYADGTTLWGQAAPFSTGTHDWQRRQVIILPEKPVKRLSCYTLFRSHSGKAWFRDVELRTIPTPEGAAMFDGVPIVRRGASVEGFQVRDVAAGSAFVGIDREALGLKLECTKSERDGATFFDVTLADTTGADRAVTLYYVIPIEPAGLHWFQDPRRTRSVEPSHEYMNATSFRAGANGRLSRYPLAAVGGATSAVALGIDMARPAFFRLGYNAGAGELFLAYDLGLTREKPTARVRFCRFAFGPDGGFRGAMARYYELFPEAFRCRTPEQGLWMPFAKISEVEGWEDFGFKFKEGDNETRWDDEHGIITFRYTEPMTWWMAMPKDMPRTLDAAVAEAKRLADQGNSRAKALFTSGYHNEAGQFPARLLDTPWCNGAVWSMNSMPGIQGEVSDFANKWSPKLREKLYGPKRSADLDGEYIDSSEGYVTDELDFRREHFAAADTPLCFAPESRKPAIFRGLVAFEYVRGIADDVHAMGKLMMANGAPSRLCWLCPLLEVAGTETDWHRRGRWTPMADADLLYRRAICKGKPFCFLMNTVFEEFSPDLVEKYMKRSLAYGMFPGFFSHNASQGHYFRRPELYNRDRPLFKKYVPLCKRVAEAGWEPITFARTDHEQVYVERFGNRYLTVFNDSSEPRTVTLTLDGQAPASSRELVNGQTIVWQAGQTQLTLQAEDVAVLDVDGWKRP
jgi:hypothetical protein